MSLRDDSTQRFALREQPVGAIDNRPALVVRHGSPANALDSISFLSVRELSDCRAELIEILLNLRHPFELDVEFTINAVDLDMDLLHHLPTPVWFAALEPASANRAPLANGTAVTFRAARSDFAAWPLRAGLAGVAFGSLRPWWSRRARDPLQAALATLVFHRTSLTSGSTISSMLHR